MFDYIMPEVTARKYRSGNEKTGGVDYRLEAVDRSDFTWPQSFSVVPVANREDRRREVEVQAFLADDYQTGPIVALVLIGPEGEANTMLSPKEARYLAMRLITAADEAYRLGTPNL